MSNLASLRLGYAERANGDPVTDTAIIYAGEIDIMLDGEGSPALAEAIVKAALSFDAARAALLAVREAYGNYDADCVLPSAAIEAVETALALMGGRP